jgi:geranylgeranyl pyrophosphate synthase
MAESPNGDRHDMGRLCHLLGRHFQIRDDYQDLASDEVGIFGP